MDRVLAWRLLFCLLITLVLGDEITRSTVGNGTIENSPPAQSMHRLITSVLDTSVDHSRQFSPGNVTNNSTFLPSVDIPSSRNAETYQIGRSNLSHLQADFIPSFFIGEVIPEPYVPDRLQTQIPEKSDRNSTNRSYQSPITSETAFAFHKILPFIEKMKEAAFHSPVYGDDNHPYLHDHVPPVHEPPAEDEDTTTPKYVVNYENHDQHSDRPSYLPYNFEESHKNMLSTKPITFDDSQDGHKKEPKNPHHNQEISHNQDYRGNNGNSFSPIASFSGYTDPYKVYHDQYGGGQILPFKDERGHGSDELSGVHSVPHYEDSLSHHQEHSFVFPSPFYPPEPDHSSVPHKDVHYKVYQNKPKSALHGLLHFAAALLPLGLFVAALQPSVIHVNASQPMPTKQRSLDTLELPGLEALERLGLGRLDHADCERKAFCELAVLGSRPGSSSAQQGLWKIANSIPNQYAGALGLAEVLKAVKAGSCASLKCLGSDQSKQSTARPNII